MPEEALPAPEGGEAAKRYVVQYDGQEYPILRELTERELFETERATGVSLEKMGNYTSTLVLSWWTVRRAGHDITWDDFLDGGGFEVAEQSPLSGGPPESELVKPSGASLTENGGTQTTQPSSASSPGT